MTVPDPTVPVEALLLDLDDTLCVHRRSVDEVLAVAFDRAGVDPFFDAGDYRRWIPEFDADSAADLRRRCFTAIADERGRDRDAALSVARAYGDLRDPADVVARPGVEAALDRLAADYPLALVTNGAREVQRAKLDALGIADAFDAAVYPETTGAVKPDPEPIRHALDSLGVAPDRAVHVGDSLAADVAAARAAGVRSAWIPRTDDGDAGPLPDPDPTPTYVLDGPRALATPPWE